MVRKEIYAHLLGYNLIRHLMVDASESSQIATRRLSVKGTIQQVNANREVPLKQRRQEELLKLIAEDVVPNRPDRLEPRVRKRRPKSYKLMTKPRHELKPKSKAA